MTGNEIDISSDNLKLLLNWVTQKIRKDIDDSYLISKNGGGEDWLGGYLDRWINRLPEYLVLKEILMNKEYDPVPDFFIYGNDTEKNAPDLLGIKTENSLKKFCEFESGGWKNVENRPFIEIKQTKLHHKLVSIEKKESDESDYVLFTSMDMKKDYLAYFLESDVYSAQVAGNLEFDEEFLVDDIETEDIEAPKNIDSPSLERPIGTIELLATLYPEQIQRFSYLASEGEEPYGLSNIDENFSRMGPSRLDEAESLNEGFHQLELKDDNIAVPLQIEKKDEGQLEILARSGSTVYIRSETPLTIYGHKKVEVDAGEFKLKFDNFERNRKNDEYLMHKGVAKSFAEDRLEELIEELDSIAE